MASSNDTALDIEMSELLNLVSQDYSESEQDTTVVRRPPWQPPETADSQQSMELIDGVVTKKSMKVGGSLVGEDHTRRAPYADTVAEINEDEGTFFWEACMINFE